jgi:16S rRNA (cytosine967-C5)-methyltransferase
VSELVYAILRRRAWLDWRLANAGAGTGQARLLVLAQLADGEVPDNEIAALFDGSEHAPLALSLEETAIIQLLRRPPSGSPPPSVVGNYPSWLHAKLERRFGTNLAAEMAALNERAPLDLRVNTLRSDRSNVLEQLRADGFDAEPTPYARTGVRVAGSRRIDSHAHYREGLVEIQDEGSQIVADLVGAQPGERIIDYCAGAGGKTLALAALMGNQGEVVACDTGPVRLRNLAPRAARAGATNIRICAQDNPETTGVADRVLLDVPCSGTGAWRRRPDARMAFSQEKLNEYNALQGELLVKGAALTAPDGVLVYATCSILVEEGADRVESFLDSSGNFEVVPPDALWTQFLDGDRPGAGPFVNLSPASTRTDGFFVAVLRRMS